MVLINTVVLSVVLAIGAVLGWLLSPGRVSASAKSATRRTAALRRDQRPAN
jgi:hypothetical protein